MLRQIILRCIAVPTKMVERNMSRQICIISAANWAYMMAPNVVGKVGTISKVLASAKVVFLKMLGYVSMVYAATCMLPGDMLFPRFVFTSTIAAVFGLNMYS
ncbi:hypothetical protein F5Y16DRAFT_392907 [Xylariaceae sp. FL0255]|nr:hypothetical protein F5Y16DRAFT_392907 [Xylariaceae sp. FL0255]